ncbi:type IX secretion system protein PorD [Ferruginibacter albus]|uniref:type IX secretion system protein PorD n=1 Tax=Ferruginibacter albus TaxID=2875540 RepID=UPI001CC419A2|nr:DUF4835 family protein [Ferruginibacter albus]UAY52669.1 DUF4835 family protein [Ferruginibacter albus]
MYKIIIVIVCILTFNFSNAQELNARVTVNTSSVGTTVNQNVFQTLQSALTTFINNRKWTSDNFLPNEKIDCSFSFTLQPTDDQDVYNVTLTVQAGRPVYNTSYLSPIINFQDKDVQVKYVQYQQLQFSDNNVAGTNPLQSNLTAVIAYYAYMILGFDYDSFSPRGGDVYFQKAQNVVNNAPEDRGITGWKAFDGVRNRYWLVENMLNQRYTIMHDVYYNYYRKGMDKLYDDDKTARTEIMNVLNQLNSFKTENPNVMISQFFFQGKTTELINIFSKAAMDDKARASDLLQKLDITNANRYKEEIK